MGRVDPHLCHRVHFPRGIRYDAEWPEGTGFVISTLVFLSGAQVLTGYRNPFYISLISAGISAFLYAVFAIFFKVPLP